MICLNSINDLLEKRPTHSQVESVVEGSVAAEVGKTRTKHNAHVKRARAAAGTAEMDVSAIDCTDMHNIRMRLVGTRVECALMVQPGDRLKVFTRGTDGEEHWKGRSGEWQQHRVQRVEWRDDSGGPEAMLMGQGKQSWHHLVNLEAVAEREKGSGQSKCDRVCEQALQWMGQGSVVEVEWPVQRGSRLVGEWNRGAVIGREGVQQAGIMVRYTDRSVVAHTDLTERGCRVLSFRRWVSTWQHQQEAFRFREEECPYWEEEANCECWWCNKEYWEPMYSAVGAGRHQRRELMATGVAERLQWVLSGCEC